MSDSEGEGRTTIRSDFSPVESTSSEQQQQQQQQQRGRQWRCVVSKLFHINFCRRGCQNCELVVTKNPHRSRTFSSGTEMTSSTTGSNRVDALFLHPSTTSPYVIHSTPSITTTFRASYANPSTPHVQVEQKKMPMRQIRRSLLTNTVEELQISERRLDRRFMRTLSSSPSTTLIAPKLPPLDWSITPHPSSSPSNLTKLVLNRNQLGDEGVRRLVKHLGTQECLEELDLSWNRIGVDGASALATLWSSSFLSSDNRLLSTSRLHTLKLSGNPIGSEGVQALLSVSTTFSSSDTGFSFPVENLNLWDCQVGDEGCIALGRALKSSRNINSLVLDNNGIGDTGALALAKGLKNNSSLWSLHLYCNEIGDTGIHGIMQALASGWRTVSNDKMNSIVSLSYLEELGVCGNQIGLVGAASIADNLNYTKLKRLNLSHNAILDEGVESLAVALSDPTKQRGFIYTHQFAPSPLEELKLSSNHLGNKSAHALAKALQTKNSNLHLLALDGNPDLDRRGASAFVPCLRENKKLIELPMLEDTYENHLVLDKMEFYLELNRSGRRYFGDVRIPDPVWPRIIKDLKRPDYIYMALRDRPDIICK